MTVEEIDTFWRDGVVCLRSVLRPDLIDRMSAPVEDVLQQGTVDMTEMGEALASSGASILRDAPGIGRFRAGTDHWRVHPAFRSFATDGSPLPEIAAALLRTDSVFLYEDSVLVKEPGTAERTAWHQDYGYFHLSGDQLCTMWCPLDSVTADTGAVMYVKGSHRWPQEFKPNLFVTQMTLPGTEGDDVPDVNAGRTDGRYEIIVFETEPGDVTVHHARTVHGAGANHSTNRRRRAISVRYAGDDARYRFKAGAPRKDDHTGLDDGDLLGHEHAPEVWPRTPRAR